jgi:ubiquinone/menaquinone biosynthesis C-methylase UbiE
MEIRKLSNKYHGDMAESYDALREGTPQWESEQRIVEGLLAEQAHGISVLDVPVGTGRFIKAYAESGFSVTGKDRSYWTPEKAQEKGDSCGSNITLLEGSIDALGFPDGSFDAAVCIRFMDWVDTSFFRTALAELARVSREVIIVSIPTYTPLSEIKLFSVAGLTRFVRQWKLRFHMARTRSDAVVHSKREVYETFRRLGLRVESVSPVDSPSSPEWKRGEDRGIYLLRTDQ